MAEIITIANLFFELLKSFCKKGNVTEQERELLIRIADEKFNWNASQVKNLIDLELYPRFRQEEISEESSFYNKAIELGIDQVEVAEMQRMLDENNRKSNYWINRYLDLKETDQKKIGQIWSQLFNEQCNSVSGVEEIYEDYLNLKKPSEFTLYLERVANDDALEARLLDEGVATVVCQTIIELRDRLRKFILNPKELSEASIEFIAPINQNSNEEITFEAVLGAWDLYQQLGLKKSFIDQKWHFYFSAYTPQVQVQLNKLCNPGDASDYTVFFQNYVLSKNYQKSITGLGVTKKQRILNSLDSIAQMILKLSDDSDNVEFISTVMDISVDEHISFLRTFYEQHEHVPVFWIFRYFIMKNNRGRDAEITINLISEQSLSFQELSQIYGVSSERIRQIAEDVPMLLDQAINVFKQYSQLPFELYLAMVVEDCPTLENLTQLVNEKEMVHFSSAFYRYFFFKLMPDKFKMLGDLKLLIGQRDSIKANTDHQYMQTYLVLKSPSASLLEDAIRKMDLIARGNFGELNLRLCEFSELGSIERTIFSKEAANWRVKLLNAKGKLYSSYTETPFVISNEGFIKWQNRQPFYHQVYPIFLREVFYEIEPESSFTAAELKEKFIPNAINKWNLDALAPELINRFKKEAGIVSIANRWMSEAYARTLFDESIFGLSKCSYRDAVVSMIKKNVSYNGLTRKDWVNILNNAFKSNYTDRDLYALSNDDRFIIETEKQGRNQIQRFFLQELADVGKLNLK